MQPRHYAGANVNPERRFPLMFEPIHGSAPDIAGKGISNPIGAISAGVQTLDYLGRRDLHDRVLGAVERPSPAEQCGRRTWVERPRPKNGLTPSHVRFSDDP